MNWFRKAAEQGSAKAQYNLGRMYNFGDGVAKDSGEAVKWLCKAANQGNVQAEGKLWMFYEIGEGVPKDEIEALAWLNVAAASGDETLVNQRDSLEKHLGLEATLLSQQRSKEIFSKIEANKDE